jgi:hypothetical protein
MRRRSASSPTHANTTSSSLPSPPCREPQSLCRGPANARLACSCFAPAHQRHHARSHIPGPPSLVVVPPPAPAWVLRKLRRVPLAHARAAINRRWVDAVAQKHDDNFPISSPNAATSPIRAISHNSPARRAHLPSRMRCPSAPSSCRRSRCRHRLSRWLPSRPTPIALAPQRPGG